MSLKSSLRHDYALYKVEPSRPGKIAENPIATFPLAFWLGLLPAGVVVGLLIAWIW